MNRNCLRTDKIALRALEPSDCDFLYDMLNDTSEWITTDSFLPSSRRQLQEYIESSVPDPFSLRSLVLVIEENAGGEAVGTVNLSQIDMMNRRAEAGVFILRDMRRRGYASDAIDSLCRYAAYHLGLSLLTAYVAIDNTPSLRLFERMGFEKMTILPGWLRRGKKELDCVMFIKKL